MMITLLRLMATLEVATGIALMINPDLVTRWLFGGGLSGPGLALSRVAGFALFALGVACWPDREIGVRRTRTDGMLPMAALFAYNLLVAIYLAYLGIFAHLAGILLWPAVAVHTAGVLLTAMTLRHTRQV